MFLAAFLTQTVSLEDATVKFEIWDTAGQGDLAEEADFTYLTLEFCDYNLTFDTILFSLLFCLLKCYLRTVSKSSTHVLSRSCSGDCSIRH